MFILSHRAPGPSPNGLDASGGFPKIPGVFSKTIRDRLPVIEQYVRSGSVLDLGCVDARNAREKAASRIEHKPNLLFKRICEVNADTLGVDIDLAGVQVLQGLGFKVVCADVESMDLARTFDTIVAGELIEHLENPGRFLRNMRRHLTDHGVLILTTPNPFYAGQAWKIWRYGRPSVHEDHMGWQDPTTLDQLLRRTGFEPFDGYWVQPRQALFKTWKRLFRKSFSHSFMRLAHPAQG